MLAATLSIGTGYGVWVSTQDKAELSSTTLDCFKIYYPDGKDVIEMRNITPVTTEKGLETSPYTLAIENICSVDKELQVRLNILDETTVDLKALTLEATGNVTKETSLYNNLEVAKSEMDNVTQSRLVGLATVKPGETVRTNIKLWFDEVKSPKIEKDKIFKMQFELIDTDSSVKAKFYEMLLADKAKIEAKAAPNFANVSTSSDGLYVATSSTGKTYYYRGVVTNNYVSFGNFIWRIISINEDGTIKLILDKSATYSIFNNLKSPEKDFAGYKYLWYNTETASTIVEALDVWYNNNIITKDLDKYVVAADYCNDTGYKNDKHIYFNAYNRLVTEHTPSLTCPTSTSDFGGIYNNKVGLITADEVVMAGGEYNANNMNYYLYNGESFITFTPFDFNAGRPNIFSVTDKGALSSVAVDKQIGLRPVITLDSNITVTGSGTIDNPYTIDME